MLDLVFFLLHFRLYQVWLPTGLVTVDNIMMQPGLAQRRSFLVLEEGEVDGTTAYWDENHDDDDDDGAEGYFEILDGAFWVYNDAEYT